MESAFVGRIGCSEHGVDRPGGQGFHFGAQRVMERRQVVLVFLGQAKLKLGVVQASAFSQGLSQQVVGLSVLRGQANRLLETRDRRAE